MTTVLNMDPRLQALLRLLERRPGLKADDVPRRLRAFLAVGERCGLLSYDAGWRLSDDV